MSRRRPRPDTRPDPILQTYNFFLGNAKIGDDGNAYSETLVPAQRESSIARRMRSERLVSVRDTVGVQPRRGAPLLSVLVRRFLNVHLHELTCKMLRCVPWQLMEPVWEDALSTGQDSFKVWSTFANVYGDEPNFRCCSMTRRKAPWQQERLRKDEVPGHEPIAPLLSAISSQTCKWLVILDLRPSGGCTRVDLLDIANVPNLGALDVSHMPGLDLDDGIIRAWSRAAIRQGKLKRLKVLQMKGHRNITINALESLAWIESLEIVNVSDCRIEKKEFHGARRLGWTKAEEFGGDIASEIMLQTLRNGEEESGAERLVAHITMAPSPYIYVQKPAVFRRARRAGENAKRSESLGAEDADSCERPPKRQRTVREAKRKDLLAEFLVNGAQGKSK